MSDNNLYLFIDESGNFDFSSSGTKHLVMSVVATVNPTEVAYKLARLKYELLRDGHDIPNFHATADKQLVRNRVFAELERLPVIEAHSFWLRKRNHMSVDQNTVSVYGLFGEALAGYLEALIKRHQCGHMVLVLDKALHAKDERAVRAKLKPLLVKTKIPFHIYFHNVSKDFNGQVADYVAWAQYVALERQEFRPLWALPANLSGSSNLLDVPKGLRRVTPSR